MKPLTVCVLYIQFNLRLRDYNGTQILSFATNWYLRWLKTTKEVIQSYLGRVRFGWFAKIKTPEKSCSLESCNFPKSHHTTLCEIITKIQINRSSYFPPEIW